MRLIYWAHYLFNIYWTSELCQAYEGQSRNKKLLFLKMQPFIALLALHICLACSRCSINSFRCCHIALSWLGKSVLVSADPAEKGGHGSGEHLFHLSSLPAWGLLKTHWPPRSALSSMCFEGQGQGAKKRILHGTPPCPLMLTSECLSDLLIGFFFFFC